MASASATVLKFPADVEVASEDEASGEPTAFSVSDLTEIQASDPLNVSSVSAGLSAIHEELIEALANLASLEWEDIPATNRATVRAELWRSLDEPVEDGVAHPGEEILLNTLEHERAGEWIQSIYLEALTQNPEIAAGILRCVARLAKEEASPWGTSLVVGALANPIVSVREAAVTAIENWEERGLLRYLKQHQEPVRWLAGYIKKVIRDLELS